MQITWRADREKERRKERKREGRKEGLTNKREREN
jgi:hypothetical protein